MYPLKFKNLYFEKIWGGRDLEKFRDNMPEGFIGESWDISCNKKGISIVENGELRYSSLSDLIVKYKEELLGTKIDTREFPLLIKLINSNQKLSVQVHPDDKYASEHENERGKTEAWYVIDAKPNSKLIIGTKKCSKDVFIKAIENNRVEEYLNFIDVNKGDFFLINSGTIHAICEGVIIAEIQQNSDITYRVYDYGRPRELHVNKALDVIDFNNGYNNIKTCSLIEFQTYSIQVLCKTEYFNIDKIIVKKYFCDKSDLESFFILTIVEGKGFIKNKDYSMDIYIGDSVFIPATLGEYIIEGEITLLKTYC